VREIVRAHDGTIEVASAAGATTFTMRLPRGSGSSPPPGWCCGDSRDHP